MSLPQVDSNDPAPKYLQARDILVNAIQSKHIPPGAKLPSTKEISELVNISLITAHRALNELVNTGLVRREVGRGTFVRDEWEAELAQHRVTIALMLDQRVNLDDYYHSTIIQTLRRAANEDTHRVDFYFHDRFDARDMRTGEMGVICVHPTTAVQSEVERLAQAYPLVLLGGSFHGGRIARVDCDNFAGARAAVRHLIELGHRRFIVLSGPMDLSNSRDRCDGTLAELTDQGVQLPDEDFIVSDDAVSLPPALAARLRARLTGADRPTAIIAGGYYLALASLHIAAESNLRIPDDVSVVGFDDPVSAPLLNPPLTTVRQPLVEMAQQAYSYITESVCGGVSSMKFTRLPVELVVRGSTGPVG
jgi:GntR family transcriptional regulator of arabinose operon